MEKYEIFDASDMEILGDTKKEEDRDLNEDDEEYPDSLDIMGFYLSNIKDNLGNSMIVVDADVATRQIFTTILESEMMNGTLTLHMLRYLLGKGANPNHQADEKFLGDVSKIQISFVNLKL